MRKTCITLLSGGLDSLLITRIMAMQDLDVVALHAINCFHGAEKTSERQTRLKRKIAELGAKDIVFPDITDEVVAVTKAPKHGYGKNLNACIDCRLRTVRAGFRVMREMGADFVVSGEVVGQRPMSQRRDAIALADREVAAWGFPGLLLRPLSAKLLPETVPQREGWVDPELLFDISGRGRTRQAELAAAFGVGDYPTPAGGCLLTDEHFSGLLRHLMRTKPDWTADDVELLKVGRHFRGDAGESITVGRNEEENEKLRLLARQDDWLYSANDLPGATVMLRGGRSETAERTAMGLAVHFSKCKPDGRGVVRRRREDHGEQDVAILEATAIDPVGVPAAYAGRR